MKAAAKAVVIGGSIAGLSAAHALISIGWEVIILEKSIAPPSNNPTGAGLGLDSLSCSLLNTWLNHPLIPFTLPLSTEQNQANSISLTRDDNFNFRAAHWSDLHTLLYNSLPSEIFLWGHLFIDFEIQRNLVSVTARVLNSGELVRVSGDLLIAADGCFSTVRHRFLPDFKPRYAGYCAWRGVFDFSGKENSDTMVGIRDAYPDLGKCLYFDLGPEMHVGMYELMNKRINWIWYVNRPEPQLKGNSVTMKVSQEMTEAMHKEAVRVWNFDLAKLISETKDPFLNVIYDSDPLERIYWGNVVLVGDAAHPTTPHCLRSTNMSILDAAVLANSIDKWGFENLESALEEYQSIRLPVVSAQTLHSRRVGRIKQGLLVDGFVEPFDVKESNEEFRELLEQKNIPFFANVPPLLQET